MTASTNNESSEKGKVISKYRTHQSDTGSPEVQVALITQRLETLTKHFETHNEDEHSRRGMFRMISRRKKLLEYLKREDVNRYRATIAALGLRK